MRKPKASGPPPDLNTLRSAALAYLARYAATEAGLTRVLAARVDRWGRAAEGEADIIARQARAARQLIAQIVAGLAEKGAVSDTEFARSRTRSLSRAGRCRRAIGALLAKSGVPGAMAQDALPRDERTELAGALIHARKRRMGPWRSKPPMPETARRELASMARAGFAHGVAALALRSNRDEAETLIAAFRADL